MMGSGIATVMALHNIPVVLKEVNAQALAQVKELIKGCFRLQLIHIKCSDKKKLSSVAQIPFVYVPCMPKLDYQQSFNLSISFVFGGLGLQPTLKAEQ